MMGRANRSSLAAGIILALSSVIFGSGMIGVAQAQIQPVIPVMTIVIHNNSPDFNIYPLISFPGATPDKWIQAFLGVKQADLGDNPYPSASTTRMYVNCCAAGDKGIPPGGSATIRLPLYSPLVTVIDPKKTGQLVEWWQGGNINIYESPKGKGPPLALLNLWNDKTQKSLNFVSNRPNCPDEAVCRVFSATTGNPPPDEPHQLVEYTLGAAPVNPNRGKSNEPFYLFDPQNVDYDVSYVNSAYLPIVMEPYGNPLVGYIGAPSSIGDFSDAVADFLKSDIGKGWPLYVADDGSGGVVPGKIPSALEIFAASVVNDPGKPNDGQWVAPPKFSPAPESSPPIRAMIKLWRDCQKGGTGQVCTYLNDATELLLANFDNYIKNYSQNKSWNCRTDRQPHPPNRQSLTSLQILQHLYGWVQFNEHCAADANLLQDMQGFNYPKIKNEFDRLQYWRNVSKGQYGVFHPYVALIHGPTFIDAPNTYAYSVDDAVGNMQTDGTGLIIAVGGTKNLPNPDPATPNVNFNYAYKSLSNGNFFKKYGRCTPGPETRTNPNFSSFAVPIGVTQKVSDCLITFLDNRGRQYQFQISKEHLPDTWPWFRNGIDTDPAAHAPVADSCSKNTDPNVRTKWCDFIFVFRKRLDDARNSIEYHVQLREPPPS
jgi:hypothetical protein